MATNNLNTNNTTYYNLGYLNDTSYLSENVINQLQAILITFHKNLIFRIENDDSSLALEMLSFIEQLCSIDTHLSYKIQTGNKACIKLYDEKNQYLNLAFYTLPKGHLFSAFINVLIDATNVSVHEHSNSESKNIKVVVSSTCIRSPELIIHTSHMAFNNKNTEVEIHDLYHSPELKNRYGIQNFPSLIINHQLIVLEQMHHFKT